MTKRYAYSYLRMSTDIQLKGDSRRRQLELSQNYAEQHGLILLDNMEDIGLSAYKGKNLTEGSLGKFIGALKRGEIEPNSVLLIESLDRLSRENVLTAFSLFTSILEYGVEIVTLADNQKYSKDSIARNDGQLFLTLGSMLRANDESATKSKRLQASWENKRSQIDARILTKQAPAWLTVNIETNRFEPIEEAANTLKKIFEWSIEGLGAYAITRKLNDSSIPTIGKSKFWQKSYVTKILSNPAVHGEFQPMSNVNGKKVPSGPPLDSYYPEIIDKETFLLSRSRIESRRLIGGGRKGKTLNNLFTKLVECSKCESSVIFVNKGSGPKGGKYLQCSSSKSKAGCNCPPWKYEEFEFSFFKYVSEIDIKNIAENTDLIKLKNQRTEELEILEAKIEELAKKKENLFSRLENDLSESLEIEIIERIKSIDNERKTFSEKVKICVLELKSTETSNISETKELSENYFTYLTSGTKSEEDLVLRNKLHQALLSNILVIELINEPIESIPFYTISELDSREINFLKNGQEYSEEQLDEFILTPKGNKALNRLKRSFRVYFSSGSVREVTPDLNISRVVNQSIETTIAKLRKNKKH